MGKKSQIVLYFKRAGIHEKNSLWQVATYPGKKIFSAARAPVRSAVTLRAKKIAGRRL